MQWLKMLFDPRATSFSNIVLKIVFESAYDIKHCRTIANGRLWFPPEYFVMFHVALVLF